MIFVVSMYNIRGTYDKINYHGEINVRTWILRGTKSLRRNCFILAEITDDYWICFWFVKWNMVDRWWLETNTFVLQDFWMCFPKKQIFRKHLENPTNSSQYDILRTSTNVDRLQWLVLLTLISSFVTEKKQNNKFRLYTYYTAIIYIQSSKKNKLPFNNKRQNSASRSKLYQKHNIIFRKYCWWKKSGSPVDMVNIPLLTRFCTYQVVQDFFHQQ